MSEYWKSTPKYWCKHCKTFVRDTKLEKQNHEATPRHQGNIKRFLRDLHRGQEKDEREKQRAKDEVARLNALTSGSAVAPTFNHAAPAGRRVAAPAPSAPASHQATPADRKRQMAQLAEMGISIPDEFRREMAMASNWQTISERPIYEGVKGEGDDDEDTNPEGLNVGFRKRKPQSQAVDDDDEIYNVRKGWGSRDLAYPTDRVRDDNLEALLSSTAIPRRQNGLDESRTKIEVQPEPQFSNIKKEEFTESTGEVFATLNSGPDVSVKREDCIEGRPVIFKKRKPKSSQPVS